MIAALVLMLMAEAADPFEGRTVLDDAALDAARGGFSVGGFDLDIGVTVSANGQVHHVLTSDGAALRAALDAAGVPADRYDVTTDGRLVTVVRNDADGAVLRQDVVLDIVIGEASPGLMARPAAPRMDVRAVRLMGE